MVFRPSNVQNVNSIVRQEDTWGRLLATFLVFKAILSFHDVFAPYTSYAQAFGYRTSDEERSRSAYYWQKSPTATFDGEQLSSTPLPMLD
jgi:hypothetical protein